MLTSWKNARKCLIFLHDNKFEHTDKTVLKNSVSLWLNFKHKPKKKKNEKKNDVAWIESAEKEIKRICS